MAQIRLTGKYAVGEHAFALVDDDMVEFLSRWSWKAKPNGSGSGIYAVRNARHKGKCITIRMHRVVVGLDRDNPLEVDHANHNTVDNQRSNLSAVTRRENGKNIRYEVVVGRCSQCDHTMSKARCISARNRRLLCVDCLLVNSSPIKAPLKSSVFFVACKHCDATIAARRSDREFCDDRCRDAARRARGYITPSRRRSAPSFSAGL